MNVQTSGQISGEMDWKMMAGRLLGRMTDGWLVMIGK